MCVKQGWRFPRSSPLLGPSHFLFNLLRPMARMLEGLSWENHTGIGKKKRPSDHSFCSFLSCRLECLEKPLIPMNLCLCWLLCRCTAQRFMVCLGRPTWTRRQALCANAWSWWMLRWPKISKRYILARSTCVRPPRNWVMVQYLWYWPYEEARFFSHHRWILCRLRRSACGGNCCRSQSQLEPQGFEEQGKQHRMIKCVLLKTEVHTCTYSQMSGTATCLWHKRTQQAHLEQAAEAT